MKKDTLLSYLIQGLIFVLLAGSICYSIFLSLYLPIPLWAVLGMIVLLYLVLCVVFINRWTLVFLLPTLLAGSYFWIHSILYRPLENGLLLWLNWMKDYFLGLVSLDNAFVYPTAWLVVIVISLLIYVTAIHLKILLIPLSVGIGIFILEWLLGHTQIIPMLWPFVLGIILLLSGKQHHKLSQSMTTPLYGYWQISALPLAVAMVLTALLLTPGDTSAIKWKLLADQYDSVKKVWSDRIHFTSPREPFRLSQTGFPSTSDKLGGPVFLSNDVVMGVISPHPLYLRGTILNKYSGHGWTNSIKDRRHKFRDSHWNTVRNVAFDLDEPIWEELTEEQKSLLFPELQVIVFHKNLQISTLFNTQRTVKIHNDGLFSFIPYYNGKGESFTSRNIKKDEQYVLDIHFPNVHHSDFQNYLKEQSPSLNWNDPIPESLMEDPVYRKKLMDIQMYYTQIPSSVPEEVYLLAQDITKDAHTSYEKALAIEQYLKENFTYTLSPPEAPLDQDFVYHFLFELKEGYCTYYASSMAILCRAVGLPSRYIEGFTMPSRPRMANYYEVKKANSHAWVEVYFPKVGWLTFDPTPVSEENAGGGTGYNHGPLFPEEPGGIDRETDIGNEPNEGINGNVNKIPWSLYLKVFARWSLYTLAALLVGLMISMILYYKLRLAKIRKLPRNKQLYSYYREIVWILYLYKYPILRGDTPYTFAERVDQRIVNINSSMKDISSSLVKNVYGSYEITDKDLLKAKDYYLDIESRVKDLIGLFPYLKRWFSRQFNLRFHPDKEPRIL